MSLTLGSAPFGHRPAGVFNVRIDSPERLIYFEDSPRRIRATFAGRTIVDSRRAKLLHEHGHLPVYYFPEQDVRMDLLEPTSHRTRCPRKGEAAYWTLRVEEREAENAAWSYPEPIEGAPPLAGYVAFYWNALDEWFEEDERVLGHARDPYHRIDALPSSRHVRVSVNGELVAESTRTRALFETGLPVRWYFPADDVRGELLEPSDTHTTCAYKGIASYRSVRAGGELVEDVAWYYPDPKRDAADVKDHLCFFNERVDLEVDGELQERPQTQWSAGGWKGD